MGEFKNSDEVYELLGSLLDWSRQQPPIIDRMSRSRVMMKMIVHDPDAIFLVDCRHNPITWSKGELKSPSDLEFAMSAATANRFWQGKANLLAALNRREILVKGSVTRVMGLLPVWQQMARQYVEILKSRGRHDLLE